MGTFLLVACLIFPANYWLSESLSSRLSVVRTTHFGSNRWAYKRCLGTIGGTSERSLERKFVFTLFLLSSSLPLFSPSFSLSLFSLSIPLSPPQSSAHGFSTNILWQKRKERCWHAPRQSALLAWRASYPGSVLISRSTEHGHLRSFP